MKRGTFTTIVGVFIIGYLFLNTTDIKYLLFGAIVGGSCIIAGAIQNISTYFITDISLQKFNILKFIGETLKQIADNMKKEDE